jgi:drug/metabolite transporter (DMT)-like permease
MPTPVLSLLLAAKKYWLKRNKVLVLNSYLSLMRKAFLQLHIAVFLAGFTGILGRLITLNEGLLVWYRLLFTVLSLLVLYYFQKSFEKISFKDIIKLFGVGVLAALHWVAFYASIKYSNVSVALVCFSATGFFTAITEPFITGRKFIVSEVLLGLLVIGGISLIFHFDPQYKTGIILGLICAMLAGIFPVFSRVFVQRYTAETVTLYQLSGVIIFLTAVLPIYLYYFPPHHFIPTGEDFGWLLVLSWVCTVLGFNLGIGALKKISAFTANLTYNLEPLYGIALAFAVYREDKLLTGAFYIGLLLILIAVALQTLLFYRRHKQVSPSKQHG